MNQREFAEYVEHVFRYHNQVVNELIELSGTSDDIDDEDAAELAKEEAHMLQVCASLNDVVSESMTGQDTDFQAKMRLVDAVPECEAATRKVDDLLP
jgi:hypothetical protein